VLKREETPRVEVTRSRPAQGSVWCKVTVTRSKRHSAANWWSYPCTLHSAANWWSYPCILHSDTVQPTGDEEL